MSKKFNIKPPIWPKELTFEEFKKLNPFLNENQLIPFYNQYLNKYLTELAELKLHYKQSLNKQLQLEIKNINLNIFDDISATATAGVGAASGFAYNCEPRIGCYTIGVYTSEDANRADGDPYPGTWSEYNPIDEGTPRFTVGRGDELTPVLQWYPDDGVEYP